MEIKNNNIDIDKLVPELDFESNMLKRVNDKLSLTNYQIEVLKRNGLDPANYTSLKDIIYTAEEIYEDTLDEELDLILDQLSERDYYENIRK